MTSQKGALSLARMRKQAQMGSRRRDGQGQRTRAGEKKERKERRRRGEGEKKEKKHADHLWAHLLCRSHMGAESALTP